MRSLQWYKRGAAYIGSSLKVNSLMGFGRKLANMSELKHKRFADGMKYLVKKK